MAEHSGPRSATSFARLYGRALIRPRGAMTELVDAPRRVCWGAYAVAVTAAVYTLV